MTESTSDPKDAAAGAGADWDAKLSHISKMSENARTTWFAVLGLLAFVGVTLMAHADSDFFAQGVETDLPLIGISVPTIAFFVAAPVLVAAVYIYFHVYLIALGDALAEADDTVEGVPLAERIYPWLLSRAALYWRQYQRCDRCARPQAMRWTTILISVTMAWAFGVVALLVFWWKSWALHDPGLSLWIGAFLLFSGWIGLHSFLVACRLMADRNRDSAHTRPLSGMIGSVLRILPAASVQCYDAAIRGLGHREHVSAGRPI